MAAAENEALAERLRRALAAFQETQTMLLEAHRRAKLLDTREAVERFWASQGQRIEARQAAAAAAVVAAFGAFSAAGLVASAHDRHLVTEARRVLAQGA